MSISSSDGWNITNSWKAVHRKWAELELNDDVWISFLDRWNNSSIKVNTNFPYKTMEFSSDTKDISYKFVWDAWTPEKNNMALITPKYSAFNKSLMITDSNWVVTDTPKVTLAIGKYDTWFNYDTDWIEVRFGVNWKLQTFNDKNIPIVASWMWYNPKIIVMSSSEYNADTHNDPNTIYLIKDWI